MEPQPAKLFSGEKVTVPQRWAAGTASSPEKEEMQHLADPSWGRQHCSSRHKEDTLNPLLIRLHFKLTGQNKAKNEVCKKEKERDLTICDHFLQHQVAFCCLNSCGMLLVWCLWGFVCLFFPFKANNLQNGKKERYQSGFGWQSYHWRNVLPVVLKFLSLQKQQMNKTSQAKQDVFTESIS